MRAVATFLRGNWKIISVAVILIISGLLIYVLTVPSAERLNRSVRDVVTALDGIYSGDNETPKHLYVLHALTAFDRNTFWERFWLHVALGFFIAGMLLFTVDVFTRWQMRQEVRKDRLEFSTDVWKAVAGHLVPRSIIQEIDKILKLNVSKVNVSYRITLFREPYIVPPGYIIARRTITYQLRNLTGQRFMHPVRSFLISHTDDTTVQDGDGNNVVLPRQTLCRVNNKDISIPDGKNVSCEIELDPTEEPQGDVHIVGEELLEESDRNSYTTMTLVEGLSLEIENRLEGKIRVKRVDFAHLSREELKQGSDGVYRYKGGMLPGQGILITWEVDTRGQGTRSGASA